MTKRKEGEVEEKGPSLGPNSILPQAKKVRFATAPDQIIHDKRYMGNSRQAAFPVGTENILTVSAIEDTAKPKIQKGKEEARSSQGSAKNGRSTAALHKTKKRKEASPPRDSVPTLPREKKGRSTAAPPKTKKGKEEARPPRGSALKPKAKKGKEEARPPRGSALKPNAKKGKEEARPPRASALKLPTADKARFSTKNKKAEEASLPRVSVPTFPSAKKVKFAAAPAEIIPERRNMDDLWQAAFLVGTEWDQMDSIYKFQWDFSNLENAFEEGGLLYGKKVYLFGCTEPQLVPFENQLKVVHIPVIVAVVSSFPPSDKIGIKSIQMEGETIVPMKEMKMDWVPYIPFYDRDLQVEHLKAQTYTLQCMQRRASLKQLKQERIKKYEYCLPYFYQPLKEDEIEQDTVVQIMYPTEPPVVCDFDWELDDFEEFADNLVQDEVLTEDRKEDFKEFVKERMTEEKTKQRAAREARKKAIEDMSPGTKAAFENMRFYKFYPGQTPNTPDLSEVKVPFINRYYGKAHEVF